MQNTDRKTRRLALVALVLFLSAAGLGIALAVWTYGTGSWDAPPEAKAMKNPVAAPPESLAGARAIYADKCAKCHGETGKGDGPQVRWYSTRPPDFTDARLMDKMTDGGMFWRIGEGRRPMPAFKYQLTDNQRWALVNLLRTFAPRPSAPPPLR